MSLEYRRGYAPGDAEKPLLHLSLTEKYVPRIEPIATCNLPGEGMPGKIQTRNSESISSKSCIFSLRGAFILRKGAKPGTAAGLA